MYIYIYVYTYILTLNSSSRVPEPALSSCRAASAEGLRGRMPKVFPCGFRETARPFPSVHLPGSSTTPNPKPFTLNPKP